MRKARFHKPGRRKRRGQGMSVRRRMQLAMDSLERVTRVNDLATLKHVDLHGMNVPEAEAALKTAILDALSSGECQVLVNHGRGKGVLADLVRRSGGDICYGAIGVQGDVRRHWQDAHGWAIISFTPEASRLIEGVRLRPPAGYSDADYVDLRQQSAQQSKCALRLALDRALRSRSKGFLILVGTCGNRRAMEVREDLAVRRICDLSRECIGKEASGSYVAPGWVWVQVAEK